MPPHGVHPQQAAKALKNAKVTSPLHQHLQAVAKTAPNYPGMGTKGTGVPSPSVSAVPKGYKPGKKIDLGPQPVLGFKPKHIQRQQAALGKVKKHIAKENADYARMVDPLSHPNLVNAAEGLTGYHEILHLRNHPIAGGLAIAGLLPFGRAGHILDEAHVLGESAQAAKTAEKGSRVAEFRSARKAIKAARRITPIRDEAARHAHLVDLANKAMEDRKVRDVVAAFRHESTVKLLKPGHVSPETGGEFGRVLRQGLRPDFQGLGKYEKLGAKLDNPGAQELRKQQDELRSAALTEKAGKLRGAHQSAKSWEDLVAAGGARRGQLPATEFKGFADLGQHAEEGRQFIQDLNLPPFDKQRLIDSIDAAMNGHTPAPAEQRLMEQVFGREKIDAAQAFSAIGKKNVALQIASIPRAIKSGGDLSWGFRQGLTAAAYAPKTFAKTFKGMFKPAFSEEEAQARMAKLVHDPIFPYLVKIGVPFTDLGTAERGAANISMKEEAIMSNYAEHLHDLPGIRSTLGVKQAAKLISKGVRASDRGYVVPLNEIRLALGSQLLHQALENGWNVEGKLGRDLGGFVGVLTGRGNLPTWLAKHRATINSVFFSPGLMSSRIHMLSPLYYARLDPFARQQALKAAGGLTATLFAVLFAAKMAGAKVTTDPRNSDFGKIRIGNTRIDVAGGYSQYLTLYSRLATQKSISSTSGKETKLTGKFGGQSDWDVVQNFFTNKTAPVLSEGIALAKQGRFGQPLTPTGELGNMFSPLLWNDMYQLAKAKGPGGGPGIAAATFLPDLFGVGVQNYAPPKKKSSSGFGGNSGFGTSGFGSDSGFGSNSGFGG